VSDSNELANLAEAAQEDPIASYVDESDPAVQGGWQITTLTSADWALARLAECHAEQDEIDKQAAESIRRIKERAEALKAKAARGVGFFRFKLIAWAEARRADILGGGKKKSRDFLHGRIGWRTKAGRLQVENDKALAEWLATQPIESGLYRQKLVPEMKALQAACQRDGIIPPGCTYVTEHEDIYVDVSDITSAITKETP